MKKHYQYEIQTRIIMSHSQQSSQTPRAIQRKKAVTLPEAIIEDRDSNNLKVIDERVTKNMERKKVAKSVKVQRKKVRKCPAKNVKKVMDQSWKWSTRSNTSEKQECTLSADSQKIVHQQRCSSCVPNRRNVVVGFIYRHPSSKYQFMSLQRNILIQFYKI